METMTDQLVIDADPLVLANDPALHNLLDSLYFSEISKISAESTTINVLKTALEWTGYILLKLLEVGVEILA